MELGQIYIQFGNVSSTIPGLPQQASGDTPGQLQRRTSGRHAHGGQVDVFPGGRLSPPGDVYEQLYAFQSLGLSLVSGRIYGSLWSNMTIRLAPVSRFKSSMLSG